MKVCSRCGVEKELPSFNTRKRSSDGLQAWCLDCNKASAAVRYQRVRHIRLADYAANKVEIQRSRRAKRYGLTPEGMEALFDKHGRECGGCGAGDPLQIDHDHQCCPGKQSCGQCVRGLLCPPCNKTLGFCGDSADVLRNLVLYLNRHTRLTRSNT